MRGFILFESLVAIGLVCLVCLHCVQAAQLITKVLQTQQRSYTRMIYDLNQLERAKKNSVEDIESKPIASSINVLISPNKNFEILVIDK
jgi:hypothetical protein